MVRAWVRAAPAMPLSGFPFRRVAVRGSPHGMRRKFTLGADSSALGVNQPAWGVGFSAPDAGSVRAGYRFSGSVSGSRAAAFTNLCKSRHFRPPARHFSDICAGRGANVGLERGCRCIPMDGQGSWRIVSPRPFILHFFSILPSSHFTLHSKSSAPWLCVLPGNLFPLRCPLTLSFIHHVCI